MLTRLSLTVFDPQLTTGARVLSLHSDGDSTHYQMHLPPLESLALFIALCQSCS